MSTSEDIKELLTHINAFNEKYPKFSVETYDLNVLKDKIEVAEIFDVDVSKVRYGRTPYLSYRDIYFIVTKHPHLTNSATKFKFDDNQYVQLDNGNVGCLMFVTPEFWGDVQPIWEDFLEEFKSFNPVDWDDMNFNFVYTLEDGKKLFKAFPEIDEKYRNLMAEKVKESKIAQLKFQLAKLENQ